MGTDDRAMAFGAADIPALLREYRRRLERRAFSDWYSGVRDTLRFLSSSPFLIEDRVRQIKAPLELKALRERLERARSLQARTDIVGKRFDAALNLIEERVNQSEAHAENLERYGDELQEVIASMTEGSNLGPPSDGGGSPGSQG
jgi:hypothetical protein